MEQNNISLGNPLVGKPSPSQQEIDEHFMRRCLQLAKNGREAQSHGGSRYRK